jgi:integrase
LRYRALAENSFELVAREWFSKHAPNWKDNHSDKIIRRLEVDIFPWLGARSVGEITAPELLAAIRRIESRGALETAHRALANCGQIFRYAIATGRAQRDTAADLRGALPPVKVKHHASITDPKAIGELLRNLEGYQGGFITRCALRLAPLVFLRPGELRRADSPCRTGRGEGCIQLRRNLPERRKMMQQWADYLDDLKAGAKIIPLYREAA